MRATDRPSCVCLGCFYRKNQESRTLPADVAREFFKPIDHSVIDHSFSCSCSSKEKRSSSVGCVARHMKRNKKLQYQAGKVLVHALHLAHTYFYIFSLVLRGTWLRCWSGIGGRVILHTSRRTLHFLCLKAKRETMISISRTSTSPTRVGYSENDFRRWTLEC